MPDIQQVHVDAALTSLSVMYKNSDYIAEAVAPSVPVRRQSDKYFIYDPTRDAQRSTFDRRSPGGEATEIDFDLSTDSYFCDDHALAAAIPDEERDNADPAIQPDIDRVEFLTEKIALNREVALESMLRTASSIAGVTVSSGDQWHQTAATPVAQIQAARAALFTNCGRRANVLVLGQAAFDALRQHASVVDRIKYSTPGAVGAELLAQMLDLDQVLVGRAVKNTSTKGQATAIAPVWGKNAFLLHQPARAGLKQVMAAATFTWTGAAGGANGTVVERWREPRRRADMVRVQKYYDHKLVAPSAAYRMLSVVA